MGAKLCGANKTNGEGTCRHPAGYGTGHLGFGRCKFHGGATPSQEKAAAEEMVRTGNLFYGEPVDVEPHEALLQEVRRSAGHVAWLEAQIKTEDFDVEDPIKWEGVRHRYRAEREHMVKVCAVAINAGVQEAQVRAAERYGSEIAELLERVLDGLGLTKKQKQKAPEVVRGALALVVDNTERAA